MQLYEDDETGELWTKDGFSNQWGFTVIEDDETAEAHVFPCGDTGAHVMAEDCPCAPQMDDNGVWIHRAYDDREAYATKKRRPN